jgi:dTDP-4-amino-4,6-dideoxygalactose transaminase
LLQQSANRTLNPTVQMSKMPAISARIAKIQLKKLDSLNQKRESNAAELSNLLRNLQGVLALPETSEDVEHTFTRFAVRILKGSREILMARLLKQGIDTERPYFYLPRVLKTLQAENPVATELAKSALTLPNHPLVKSSDRIHIANALTSELKSLVKEK